MFLKNLGILSLRISELDGTLKISICCLVTEFGCCCGLMIINNGFLEYPGKLEIGLYGTWFCMYRY